MVVALAFLRRGGFLISDGNSLSPLLLAAFLDFLLLVVGFVLGFGVGFTLVLSPSFLPILVFFLVGSGIASSLVSLRLLEAWVLPLLMTGWCLQAGWQCGLLDGPSRLNTNQRSLRCQLAGNADGIDQRVGRL